MMMQRNPYTARPDLLSALRQEERSIRWLARKVGVEPSHLYRIVHQERTASDTVAREVATLLNRPICMLFDSTAGAQSATEVSA